MSPIEASLLIVSDIHLHSANDTRGQLLLSVLERVEHGQVENLVLLGDIFDFCLGSHRYFQKKFAVFGEALGRVSQKGTNVIFVEGNHEFRLRDLPWSGVHFVSEGTHVVELSGGHKVQIAHGDMIYSHRRYKIFRSFVKSLFVTGVASRLPGGWMDRLAIKSSEVSRAADHYRQIDHDKILHAVDGWLETGVGDFGVFGHFHVPYAEPRRDGRFGGVFSVESWEQPNLLAFRDGVFYRQHLSEKSDSRWIKAEPYFRKIT